MDLERERGITIRMHPVTIYHEHNGTRYELNLIDTPGHVDFNYEVSRSLAACEGAILLVDAFQGVQAQTVANAFLAMDADLTIVPVLNKIDLPIARPDDVIGEMEQAVLTDPAEVLRVSGKTGIGHRGAARGHHRAASRRRRRPADAPVKAARLQQPLRHLQGRRRLRPRDGRPHQARAEDPADAHRPRVRGHRDGPVPPRDGRRATSSPPGRSATSWPRSRTSTTSTSATRSPTPPTRRPSRCRATRSRSRWSSGLYPVNNNDFEDLREALGKLKLNDSSFTYQPEVSEGLGFGFRCGFLGMLHREIIQQRLERDSDLDLVQTAPNVTYEILKKDGRGHRSTARRRCPTPGRSRSSASRSSEISFLIPAENIGDLMQMCTDRRGIYVRTEYLSPTRAILVYEMPLAEVIYDLYDKLKSVTHGYGTMDYECSATAPPTWCGWTSSCTARRSMRCR